MTNEQLAGDQVVILADESADWKIAGLRQLERVLLALNEWATATAKGEVPVLIFWKRAAVGTVALTRDGRLSRIRLAEQLGDNVRARIISTHLFLHRKGLTEFFDTTTAVWAEASATKSPADWERLNDELERACPQANDSHSLKPWQLVHSASETAEAEARFLSRAGKTQDGWVSRWINRPLTRPITRLLLKLPITPTGWTLSIFVLPILSSVFLLRGDYASVVIGTAIYQFYSMLDGCDGEIARAKYLESKRGGRTDDLCDIIGAFLFVIGLGFGLYRSHAPAPLAWTYAVEGIALAILIAVNEWALRTPEPEAKPAQSAFAQQAYPRHRRLLERAGFSGLGQTMAGWVLQLTKRDVGILLFVLLALIGWSQWILHPWLLVTLMTLGLNLVSDWKARS